MILCVTPNPAIDRTLHVKALHAGEVHRADKVLAVAGGKGLNVARTIQALGGEPLCMGLIGGHTGNLFEELAQHEGLSARWTRMKNETRTCTILVEDGSDATVINERGAEANEEECEVFINDVWKQAERVQLVCVSGSLPPGFPLHVFQSLLFGLVEQKKSVWVDTSGAALSAALRVRGINVKVNAKELGGALGVEISNTEQAQSESLRLREKGIASVVVTMGKDGALLNASDGIWFAKPPGIKIVSSVGSGDAFLGGLMYSLNQGNMPDTALRCASAAGAANALQFGGGRIRREKFEKLFCEVIVQ